MNLRGRIAAVCAAVCVLFVAGCGGGGGSSDATSISVPTRNVDVTAGYGDQTPTRSIHMTAKNVPQDGLYVEYRVSGEIISNAAFNQVSSTDADIVLTFSNPLQLPVGAYNASVELHVCYDDQCTREVSGSPVTVAVKYTITNLSSVALENANLSVTGDARLAEYPTPIVTVNVDHPPSGNLFYILGAGISNVMSVENTSGNTSPARLKLYFRQAAGAVGIYPEDVTVRVCYDSLCTREVPGSPLVIHTTYTVVRTAPTEPGMTALPYVSRQALSHDVVDAEYDRAREAIVMVSGSPSNALYLYDLATGTEKKVSLNKLPTSVSVSPNGRYAAVGHDALITHVDLQSLASGTAVTKLLNVTTNVLDLVLDGQGKVHALPAADQWVSPHSVDVATNTETLGTPFMYAGTLGRLHPSGNFMYTADNNLSPSDIAKWDLTSGVATRLYDSPYHGDYAMCGNLWFKQDGSTIYTACGNAFKSSTTQSQDMVYNGHMELSESTSYGYRIRSLSESDATKEIMLLEEDWYACQVTGGGCYTHLAVYESDFLNRSAVYSLAPMALGGNTFLQRGRFVFHSGDGLHRYLISDAPDGPGATTPTFLTIVQ